MHCYVSSSHPACMILQFSLLIFPPLLSSILLSFSLLPSLPPSPFLLLSSHTSLPLPSPLSLPSPPSSPLPPLPLPSPLSLPSLPPYILYSFYGRKEGGINKSASYYVLRLGQDGDFEALPVNNWYLPHP